jgi:hypothetical protein
MALASNRQACRRVLAPGRDARSSYPASSMRVTLTAAPIRSVSRGESPLATNRIVTFWALGIGREAHPRSVVTETLSDDDGSDQRGHIVPLPAVPRPWDPAAVSL